MPRDDCEHRQFMMYFPSQADRERWRALAEASKQSFTSWIYDTVEIHLNEDRSSGKEYSKGYLELKTKIAALEESLTNEHARRQALEYQMKFARFDIPDFEGKRAYDEELVILLRQGKTFDSAEILKALGIQGDVKAMRLVQNQLEKLSKFGLIKETVAGWRWAE